MIPRISACYRRAHQITRPRRATSHSRYGYQGIGTAEFNIPGEEGACSREPGNLLGTRVITPHFHGAPKTRKRYAATPERGSCAHTLCKHETISRP